MRGKGIEARRRTDVDPRGGEVELRVRRAPSADAWLDGTVVGPDGAPVANAKVYPRRVDASEPMPISVTGADGRFEIGPGCGSAIEQTDHAATFTAERRVA